MHSLHFQNIYVIYGTANTFTCEGIGVLRTFKPICPYALESILGIVFSVAHFQAQTIHTLWQLFIGLNNHP